MCPVKIWFDSRQNCYVGKDLWVMLDGMSDSIQRSRIENLHSREVDRQSPTGLIFALVFSLLWLWCYLPLHAPLHDHGNYCKLAFISSMVEWSVEYMTVAIDRFHIFDFLYDQWFQKNYDMLMYWMYWCFYYFFVLFYCIWKFNCVITYGSVYIATVPNRELALFGQIRIVVPNKRNMSSFKMFVQKNAFFASFESRL